MAIPDRRGCFDFFRPLTRLSEWIDAFVEERSQPSCAQTFDSSAFFARNNNQEPFAVTVRNTPPAQVSADMNLDGLFGQWMQRLRTKDEKYY